jgi:probable HAF family extracellular repeat protein
VVGASFDFSVPDVGEAFRWLDGTGMIGLGKLPGATYSSAGAVSADGSVVVGSSGTENTAQAFRWTAEGGMVGLGPAENTYSFATGVSADGSVVVGAADDQAFRWTENTGMVGLGYMPGGSTSYPYAVTADGSVVVGYGSGAPTGNGAFIWDAVHGMRLLQQVLTEDYGLDLSGWNLWQAAAVSGDGRTIVGSGTNPSGETEAWIAVLPDLSEATVCHKGRKTLTLNTHSVAAHLAHGDSAGACSD